MKINDIVGISGHGITCNAPCIVSHGEVVDRTRHMGKIAFSVHIEGHCVAENTTRRTSCWFFEEDLFPWAEHI